MKILFLSRWYPFPPNNGSKLRIHNLLHGLAQAHEVRLLTFVEPQESAMTKVVPPPFAGRTHVVVRRPYNADSVRARFGLFSLTPRFVLDTYSTEMAAEIQRALKAESFDCVVASQFDMAVYSRHFGALPALLEELEVGSLYANFTESPPGWRRIRTGLTWTKHRLYLKRLLRNFRMCTVASTIEQEIVVRWIGAQPRVTVVPNCVDLQRYRSIKPSATGHTVIFTGAFSFTPNFQAMDWFVRFVWPAVRTSVPQARLLITGDPDGKSLPDPGGVLQTGHVEDIHSLVAAADISIAPLLSGGGSRLKILEAMALGTPVVATPKGAEGLDVESGRHLLIAESPDEFAHAIVALFASDDLRRTLAEEALRLVAERYDSAVVVPHFVSMLESQVFNAPATLPKGT